MKYQKDRPCPKCEEIGAMTEYRDSYDKGDLQRRCWNCGYSWTEEPLDEEAGDEHDDYILLGEMRDCGDK